MASLSEKEQAMLKKLQAKAEAPDRPSVGRSLSAHIDLSDEKQIALAKKFGFLDDDDDDDDDEGDETEDEETPKRKGFFDQ